MDNKREQGVGTVKASSDAQIFSRRQLAMLLGGAGAAALSGCVGPEASAQLAHQHRALSGGSAQWADTIADLRSMSGTSQHSFAIVYGYNSIGDGGGGVFYWDSASTAVDDGGLVFGSFSPSGRWRRILPYE